jgi:hypothetical protein
MKLFDPFENETIRMSNLMFGLINWFYNKGNYRTCPSDEGLFADQRVFGPAHARGLLEDDGKVWKLTQAGVDYYEQFMNRSAWKETPSKQYSHWIKVQRTRHNLRVLKGGRQARAMRKAG